MKHKKDINKIYRILKKFFFIFAAIFAAIFVAILVTWRFSCFFEKLTGIKLKQLMGPVAQIISFVAAGCGIIYNEKKEYQKRKMDIALKCLPIISATESPTGNASYKVETKANKDEIWWYINSIGRGEAHNIEIYGEDFKSVQIEEINVENIKLIIKPYQMLPLKFSRVIRDSFEKGDYNNFCENKELKKFVWIIYEDCLKMYKVCSLIQIRIEKTSEGPKITRMLNDFFYEENGKEVDYKYMIKKSLVRIL